MLQPARAAGYRALLLTADTTVRSRRLREQAWRYQPPGHQVVSEQERERWRYQHEGEQASWPSPSEAAGSGPHTGTQPDGSGAQAPSPPSARHGPHTGSP
ncbi:MAG: hypothetical protein ACLPUO_14365 [Streptosporangiaceae bacterium]